MKWPRARHITRDLLDEKKKEKLPRFGGKIYKIYIYAFTYYSCILWISHDFKSKVRRSESFNSKSPKSFIYSTLSSNAALGWLHIKLFFLPLCT